MTNPEVTPTPDPLAAIIEAWEHGSDATRELTARKVLAS